MVLQKELNQTVGLISKISS